jgi:hypothetical protein
MSKKEKQPVKCAQCDLEFSDSELSEKHKNKAFVFRGKVMCEDCLYKMGVNADDAMTYAAFLDNQEANRPQNY